MQTKFIRTKDYLLLTNNTNINKKDWFYSIPKDMIFNCTATFEGNLIDGRGGIITEVCKNDCGKIIGHLPIDNAPLLEGIDLLSDFESINNLALKAFPSKTMPGYKDAFSAMEREGFVVGYKTAQVKQFTLEDIEKAVTRGMAIYAESISGMYSDSSLTRLTLKDDYIQQIQQSKLPIDFIPNVIRVKNPIKCKDVDLGKWSSYLKPGELYRWSQPCVKTYPISKGKVNVWVNEHSDFWIDENFFEFEYEIEMVQNSQGQKTIQGEYKF